MRDGTQDVGLLRWLHPRQSCSKRLRPLHHQSLHLVALCIPQVPRRPDPYILEHQQRHHRRCSTNERHQELFPPTALSYQLLAPQLEHQARYGKQNLGRPVLDRSQDRKPALDYQQLPCLSFLLQTHTACYHNNRLRRTQSRLHLARRTGLSFDYPLHSAFDSTQGRLHQALQVERTRKSRAP